MNPREEEIEAPWGKIAVKLWGNANDKPVITLHGLMDNAGSFDGLIPLLPQHYFYICVDLPGHGKSSHHPPHMPIITENYFLLFRCLMDYFKRDKYILMGHSYGGGLNLMFDILYPHKVEKLILIDVIHLLPVRIKFFRRYVNRRIDSYFNFEDTSKRKSPPQYTYDEALARVTGGRAADLPESAAKSVLNRMLRPVGNERFELTVDQRLKFLLYPLHDSRYLGELLEEYFPQHPILILLSQKNYLNKTYGIPALKLYQKLPNVRIEFIEGDHFVHMVEPEKVSKHIVKFLNTRNSKI